MLYRIDPEQSGPATQADGVTQDSYLASAVLDKDRCPNAQSQTNTSFLFRSGLYPGNAVSDILFVISETDDRIQLAEDKDYIFRCLGYTTFVVPDADYEEVLNEICDALGVKGIGQNGLTVLSYHEAERTVIVNPTVSAG